MIELFREAHALQQFMTERGWPFCFIGGVALLARFPGRRPDARAFALRHRVLLLSTPAGVGVDVALGAVAFERDMIARAIEVEFEPGVALRICSAEDLLVLKAFADRLQDRADVEGIARRRGRQLDWDAVETRLTPLVEPKGEPGILEAVRALREQYAC